MITSIKNPHIKMVRDLLNTKKARDESGQMVLEGVRLAEEALNNGITVRECYFSDNLSERGRTLLLSVGEMETPIEELPMELMHRVSNTQHAQGILLVCDIPQTAIPHNPTFLLALDKVSDPGNMGTILRAAAALGVEGALLTPGCTDPFAPKALRAAMGAQLHLPVLWQDAAAIKATCQSAKKPLMLTSSLMECEQECWDIDLSKPICLVIGNEANGISPELTELSDACVRIPITDSTESFNAAVAAGILMYEIKRQRTKK